MLPFKTNFKLHRFIRSIFGFSKNHINGIGVDILQKSRIFKIKNQVGFAKRILSMQEFVIYNQKTSDTQKANYLAKRFCAKEAISKALGTGIGFVVSFKDLSVLNNLQGAPFVLVHKKSLQKLKILVSISDEKDYCIAFATVKKSYD